MSTNWGRGVYVDGELSTWGTTPIATMAHQVHASVVTATQMNAIPSDSDITTAAHNIEGGTLLVVRVRSSNRFIHDAQMRRLIAQLVRRFMGQRGVQNAITPTTYVGMITFVNEKNEVIEDFSHIL